MYCRTCMLELAGRMLSCGDLLMYIPEIFKKMQSIHVVVYASHCRVAVDADRNVHQPAKEPWLESNMFPLECDCQYIMK